MKNKSKIEQPSTAQDKTSQAKYYKYLQPTNSQAKSRFTAKELPLLKKRFEKLAGGSQTLNRVSFREGLGLLGLEHATFLSDRLFNIIDSSADESIDFKEFMQYLAIVLNGSEQEKAQMSFRFLDIKNQGKLLFKDFQQLIFDIAIFWNMITGGKIIPQQERIEKIWNTFTSKSGELTFTEYCEKYENLGDAFDWFRFFNQDDNTSAQQAQEQQAALLVDVYHSSQSVGIKVTGMLNILDHHLHESMLQLKGMEQIKQNYHSNQSTRSNNTEKLFSNFQQATQFQGPCFVHLPTESKRGDESPQNDEHIKLSRLRSYQQTKFHQHLSQASSVKTNITSLGPMETGFKELLELSLQCIQEIDQHTKLSRSTFEKPTELDVLSISYDQDSRKVAKQKRTDSLKRRQTIRILPQHDKSGEVKRNISVYFGHENWNLILNMMIGMRKSVKCIPPYVAQFPLSDIEFTEKALHDILPQRTSNFDYRKVFHFIDYRPSIFYRIRLMYGVTNQDYQRSIGPETMLGDLVMGRLNSLSELGSSGKSGSFFYFTQDSKYMIKTISVLEAKFFKRILRNYFQHLQQYPQTMISRIFGFQKMKIFKSKTETEKVYLIVMCNLFETGLEIDVRYDIKGWKVNYNHLHNRIVDNQPVNPSTALKDLDMLEDKNYLRLNPKDRLIFEDQIKRDGVFFRDNQIIDYSLLVGYHYRSKNRVAQYGLDKRNPRFFRFNEPHEGGLLSKDHTLIYFFGIIDILTEYGTKKQWEHSIKSTFVSEDISCIPPLPYSKRFEEFIFRSVLEPPQLSEF